MKIATILPVYNPNHKWLTEAIESVLSQKTQHEVNLYIRFDGSDTGYVLPKSDKIFLIKDKYRRGLSGGLNFMINHIIAKSWENRYDYFARIDADDIWHEDKIKKQIEYIIKNNANVCGTWGKIINENGDIKSSDWTYANYTVDIDSLYRSKPESNFLIDPSPIIDARLVYDGLVHYNNAMLGGADYELWARLSAMKFKICAVPERLYLYRDSAMQNTKTSQWANTINACKNCIGPMYKALAKDLIYYCTSEQYNGGVK